MSLGALDAGDPANPVLDETQQLKAAAEASPAPSQTTKKKTHTRRGVLGAALAGGAAVAGVRMLVVDHPGALPRAARDLADDIRPPRKEWRAAQTTTTPAPTAEPAVVTVIEEQHVAAPPPPPARPGLIPENQRIMQLLRRTTFGYGPAELEQALHDGFERTVDRLVSSPPAPPPPFPAADAVDSEIDIGDLRRWWVKHMLTTPTPFAERMTLFWHGHFTSDYRKVGDNNPFIYWQNLTWRQMALDRLGPMLMKATIDPAMLVYLDGDGSTGESPNENYSRELMELFTMGVGNYRESDVRAGARALAGWRVPEKGEGSRVGIFVSDNAYSDPITFLGRTATFNTQAVIDQILGHGATAPFIVAKVVREFVSGSPDAAYVNRLAGAFKGSGYDLRKLMRDIFLRDEFGLPSSYRALVKSPLETMIHAAKALQTGTQLTDLIVDASTGTGHALFDPPTVQGWPFNAAWISSNSVMGRVNFMRAAIDQMDSVPSSQNVAADHLEGILGPNTKATLDAESDHKQRWFIALASPEFQHK